MSEMLLLHHAHGHTPGVAALAGRIAAAGHTVHAPDLYDGRTFDTVGPGAPTPKSLGDTFDERADTAADALPAELVYFGWSLGGDGRAAALPEPARSPRGSAAGVVRPAAVLRGVGRPGCPPRSMAWPTTRSSRATATCGVAGVRRRGRRRRGLPLSREQHLFADSSLASYDADAARELEERVLGFLARVG